MMMSTINTYSVSVGLHRLGSPAAEEAQHLVMIVALALLQETGVLDVKELAFLIEDYQDGEAEAGRMTKTLQQIRRLFRTDCSCLVAGIVVDMDIDIVAVDELADGAVTFNEVGKAQAPDAPVAPQLTDDMLVFGRSL